MNDKKISIITVSFNSVKTIERTILSVLNQSYRNIEYIIIDGGSKDGTVDIIKKYQDKIHYWVSEKDGGIGDAFNKGICLATGDIVGILNSDDWYELNTLEKVMFNFKNSNADFLIGALKYWDKNNNNFIVYPDREYKNKINYMMPNLNHPASFFKIDVYKTVGLFDLKYKLAMDYDFFLRVYSHNKKAVFTDEILTNMSFDGVSDKYAIKTYIEEFLITKNKFRASFHFVNSVFKYYIRKFIILIGLNKILFLIRKIKYKN